MHTAVPNREPTCHTLQTRDGVFAFALVSAALMSGCLSDSPLLDDPAVQGDYDDGDVEHRPGQPCLICHGDGHFPRPPGEVRFQLAGTVYGGIADQEDEGLDRVEVIVTDATGTEITAESNRVGNFMVSVDSDANGPTERDDGWLTIPEPLEFPLLVSIRRDGDEREMLTRIWRAGSCAHCHGPEPRTDSVGRVYLFQEDQQ